MRASSSFRGCFVACKYLPLNLASICALLAWFLTSPSAAAETKETCTFVHSCRCDFKNGSVIDLSSLASESGQARWKNVTSQKPEDYHYYYNPCTAFKLGPSGTECANGVAVCQVSGKKSTTQSYFDCGDEKDTFFSWDQKKKTLILNYHSKQMRQTMVTLTCSQHASHDKLIVAGETKPSSGIYEMELVSRCACADGCPSGGLSLGSGLLIIFSISVFFYLFLGIVYMHLVGGAHGWELVPNYEFWKDFPLLVRDGCVFVSGGCRRETSYERI